jgi:hypothetical protein
LKPKDIELFCCHDKTLEYDESDALLKEPEAQGEKCLTAFTTHAEFKANMLSEGVLNRRLSLYYFLFYKFFPLCTDLSLS